VKAIACLLALAVISGCRTSVVAKDVSLDLYMWAQPVGQETSHAGEVIVETTYRGETTHIVTKRLPDRSIDAPPGTPPPVLVQSALIQQWQRHGRPRSMHTALGDISVVDHGACFSVAGLGWGRSWIWFDADGRLLGAVVPDARTSTPIHAIRRDAHAALGGIIARTARIGAAFYASQAKPVAQAPRIAFVHARLIDGTGGPPLDDVTIIERNGTIDAVGRDLPLSPGIATIDLSGKTVIPGLWDMHAHLTQVEWGAAYLAAGVTTVRDLGNTLEFVTALRAASEEKLLQPRILMAGFIDARDPTSPTGYQANTPAEGIALVDMYAAARFDQIKVWNNVAPNVLRAIAAEAHAKGMTVTGHVPKGMNAIEAVKAGQDQIDHIDFILHTSRHSTSTLPLYRRRCSSSAIMAPSSSRRFRPTRC
jgi:hypothetical protein